MWVVVWNNDQVQLDRLNVRSMSQGQMKAGAGFVRLISVKTKMVAILHDYKWFWSVIHGPFATNEKDTE